VHDTDVIDIEVLCLVGQTVDTGTSHKVAEEVAVVRHLRSDGSLNGFSDFDWIARVIDTFGH
jgi:hypothetical protein